MAGPGTSQLSVVTFSRGAGLAVVGRRLGASAANRPGRLGASRS